MLYCQPLDIVPVEDLDADGPLHLKASRSGLWRYDICQKSKTPVVNHLGTVRSHRTRRCNAASTPVNAAAVDERAGGDKESPAQKTARALMHVRAATAQPVAICSTCDDGMDATDGAAILRPRTGARDLDCRWRQVAADDGLRTVSRSA